MAAAHSPVPTSPLSWSAGRRLGLALAAVVLLWGAVGWALGWLG
jgi:hypothetical protein